ncbi:MAG: SCP2 sterol-binding domain-containing protein [Myxococcota bacterium]
MAQTEDFFSSFLPNKIAENPSLKDIGATFQFEIEDAGTWSLNLTEGTVSEGGVDDADCVINTDRATWEKILDNPSSAIQMFMMGKIKASNIGLATKLQQILG